MIEDYFQEQIDRVDSLLIKEIHRLNAPERLKEAMLYSIQAGGKRIRPILLLATMEAFGCDSEPGLPVAAAIEMIHTYSLIHDDLPAMDDDDLRRGSPTNHKVYGEAAAILAGDALLTLSFQVVAAMNDPKISDGKKSELIAMLAQASGAEGMVGGQCSDLDAENKQVTVDELENIHLNKTGRLLAFSIEAGAVLADAETDQRKSLNEFARNLGLAFQIRDDILDVIGDSKQMGKNAGSDVHKHKSTYPQLLTLDGARQKLDDHFRRAKQHLAASGIDDRLLFQIADYVANRNT